MRAACLNNNRKNINYTTHMKALYEHNTHSFELVVL